MAKNPIRLAIAGCGYFSKFHVEAWARFDDVTIVGAADRDLSKARQIAISHGLPTAFDKASDMLGATKPDLVDIIAPPHAHLSIIRSAAEFGVNVICQKPFCGNLAEAQEAVALAEQAGIRLAVHENFRFQPWYREIKKLLAAGAVGQVYTMHFQLRPGDGKGEEAYLDRQPYFREMRRFMVFETAVHHFDVFRYLLGRPKAVYADLRRLNPVISGEDAGYVVLHFDNAVRAVYDGNRLVDHVAEDRRLTMGEMLIEGSTAVLRLDGSGNIFVRKAGTNDEVRHDYQWQDIGFGGDCVYAFQAHVLSHLRKNTPLESSAPDYLNNIAIVEATYRSAEGGCVSPIEYPDG
jgi:predicted dehydrogenase